MCSFRIQMESQAKVDHLIVALGADGLLGFNIISDQPAVRLNPFVGYIIAKVINPSGVLRVLGAIFESWVQSRDQHLIWLVSPLVMGELPNLRQMPFHKFFDTERLFGLL